MTLRGAIDRCYHERWKFNKDGERVYARTLKIVDILGEIQLSQVDELAINRLTTRLRELGLAETSLNRYRAYLRVVLNMAHKEWLAIPRVPHIKNTKELPTRFKVFTAEEEATILGHCKEGCFMSNLLIVLIDTGMRLGEALAITVDHLDWELNLIVLTPEITKSAKARSIPMTKRVRATLWDNLGDPALPIFNVKMAAVEKQWISIRKKMGGGPDMVLHALRHTYASRLVQAGVDLYIVKELLGHSTFSVTERYAHLNPRKLRDAMAVLEGGHHDGGEREDHRDRHTGGDLGVSSPNPKSSPAA
jgi:integrase